MEVIGELDEGGFGVVQKVKAADGRIYARKTFRPSVKLAEGSPQLNSARYRFRQEIRTLKIAAHPHVVPIIDTDIDGLCPWYTMPVAQRSLHAKILSDKRLGAVTVGPIWDVLAGLEAIHSQNIYHRDLKPTNVLLLDRGWVLADFGLASRYAPDELRPTCPGEGFGTELYMAPECYRNFLESDHRADIYAMGCILHDVFATDDPRIPCRTYTVPGAMGAVVERCTAQTPDARFSSIIALRIAMIRALAPCTLTSASIEAVSWNVRCQEEFMDMSRIECGRFWDYAQNHATSVERDILFRTLDIDQLERIRTVSGRIWEPLAIQMCHWIRDLVLNKRPETELVDLLGARLNYLCLADNLKIRVTAATTLLVLAQGTNREHLLWRWLKLITKQADDHFVERLTTALSPTRPEQNLTIARVEIALAENAAELHPVFVEFLEMRRRRRAS